MLVAMRGRRGFLLLSASAICFGAIAPTRVADSHFKQLTNVFGELSGSIRDAFNMLPTATPGQKAADPALDGATTDTAQPADRADVDSPVLPTSPDAIAAADAKLRILGVDPTNILESIAAYRADKLDAGDTLASKIADPSVRAALEWVALREVPQAVGTARLKAFAAAHADWPIQSWVRRQMETRLLRAQDPIAVESFFTESAPDTPVGKLALARALKATGRIADGTKLARAVFRESDLSGFSEGLIRAEFGADLTKADFKYRADRLLYKGKVAPALRAAAQAGADILALAKARAAIMAETPSDAAIAAVPEALRKDPGLLLAEVQRLRHADKALEAAHLMETAPHDAAALVDGDEWWTERRVLARKLLDDGKVNAAYIMCAMATPASKEAKAEAEFHAGWIALRFMNEPARAAYHLDVAAMMAEMPISIARTAYWQGRTAEASDDPKVLAQAKSFYEKAAAQSSTYYGQLARMAIGATSDLIQAPIHPAAGTARNGAIRAVELLYAAGEKDAAYSLSTLAATDLDDPDQMGALAAVITAQQDAHLALTIGKLMGQSGTPVDTLAFPTFGIPSYQPLQNSAAAPVVYSIARQESAFQPTVISKVGAKGLMQMMDATAKQTAAKAGLPFDAQRLTRDPSFNAQLGAAHLGELIAEQSGSLILTFAAYNAGGGRVKQWIDAYGDPRKSGVDPIDWVERIPFTETRNYVQRVMANVHVYEAIFANQRKATVAARLSREAKL